jgi:hypothetical protein
MFCFLLFFRLYFYIKYKLPQYWLFTFHAIYCLITFHSTHSSTHALRSIQMFEVSYDIMCCKVPGEVRSFEHFCNAHQHTCPGDTVVNRNLVYGERSVQIDSAEIYFDLSPCFTVVVILTDFSLFSLCVRVLFCIARGFLHFTRPCIIKLAEVAHICIFDIDSFTFGSGPNFSQKSMAYCGARVKGNTTFTHTSILVVENEF